MTAHRSFGRLCSAIHRERHAPLLRARRRRLPVPPPATPIGAIATAYATRRCNDAVRRNPLVAGDGIGALHAEADAVVAPARPDSVPPDASLRVPPSPVN